jgi:hypothetical protein
VGSVTRDANERCIGTSPTQLRHRSYRGVVQSCWPDQPSLRSDEVSPVKGPNIAVCHSLSAATLLRVSFRAGGCAYALIGYDGRVTVWTILAMSERGASIYACPILCTHSLLERFKQYASTYELHLNQMGSRRELPTSFTLPHSDYYEFLTHGPPQPLRNIIRGD